MEYKNFFIFSIFFWPSVLSAEIKLPAIISDNMVMQAGVDAPLWGKARPQSVIKIKCSWLNEIVITNTDSDGKWRAKVKTPQNGDNCTIKIFCGEDSQIISNISIGQVWLCSGQSNMQFAMADLKDAGKEICRTNQPGIRLFTVERKAAFTPQDDTVGKWVVCEPEHAAKFSAVGYYFGALLHQKLNVPIGLINSSFGATAAQSWTKKEILLADPELKKYFEDDLNILKNKQKFQQEYDKAISDWERKVRFAQNTEKNPPKKPTMPRELLDKNRSSTLYNAMIYPLIPYAIKGVIWYQGESNTWRLGDPNFNESYLYRKLFPAMIKSWRSDWAQRDLPFYYVQLASYGKKMKKNLSGLPDLTDADMPSDWAELRHSQFATLSLPDTGMAVAIDIGDVVDIHPANKCEAGRRLALWALAKNYGFVNIVYSGPLYKSMKIEDNKVRIVFEHTGSGLIAKDKEIKGFAVAGADKKFKWAQAEIQGDTVLVWSPEVTNPKIVKYGWSDWSDCNLYNKEGLPASPFRTGY